MAPKPGQTIEEGRAREPLLVSLPSVFAELVGGPTTRWVLLKVESSLEWRKSLAHARLRIAPGAAPEVVRCTQEVHTKVLTDPWRQFLPLRPESPGSHKLLIGGALRFALQVQPMTPEFKAVQEVLKRQRDGQAVAEKRRAAGVAHQRAAAERLRAETQKRFSLPPTSEALRAVGFELDDRQEAQADGSESLAVGNRLGGGAAQEGATSEVEILHLRVLPTSEAGCTLPLVFWGAGPLPADGPAKLEFKCYSVYQGLKGARIIAKHQDAPRQHFIGARVKKAGRLSGHRFLLGIQQEGSKRLLLEEAEVYHMTFKEKGDARTADEAAVPVPYVQQRATLVEAFGTARSKRMNRLGNARRNRLYNIAEFGNYKAELAQRAAELKAKVVSLEERDHSLKAKLLPPHNLAATSPADVYKDAMEAMAPWSLIEAEGKSSSIASKGLIELFQKSPREQLAVAATAGGSPEGEGSRLAPYGTRLALAVAVSRANSGLRAKDETAAHDLALQFGVLNALLRILRQGPQHRAGKCLPEGLAQVCEFTADSKLAAHWHREYYDEMLGRKKVRSFNGRKTLCALMVWALQLTPNLTLDFPAAVVARELRVDYAVLRKSLEFLGCKVTEEMQPGGVGTPEGQPLKRMTAVLQGPPKTNTGHYERQIKPAPKKGRRG